MEPEVDVSDIICRNADAVLEILNQRYDLHFKSRNVVSKTNHFSFKWAKRNLPQVVAAMAYFNHLKPGMDEFLITRDTCLLASPIGDLEDGAGTFLSARDDSKKNLEGRYLYYDVLNGHWIRSGKVSGDNTNFGERDKQHDKCAMDPAANSSDFYLRYPDVSVKSRVKKGNFQNLKQNCGLSFQRGQTNALTSLDNGILEWDTHPMDCMNSARKDESIENYQLTMASYLKEFASDLCLSDTHNVSGYPGFQMVAHTYNRDD